MSKPGEFLREPPPASEAPEIIYLPPPANDPAPGNPAPQRKNGRAVSTKPGSQISRRRAVKDPLDAWIPATRCTKAQRAEADAEAERAGISLNGYVRRELFGKPGPRTKRRVTEETKFKTQILAALGRSGNNLNQLLQKVNRYDFRGHPELLDMAETMKAAHAAHHELVAAIKAELGV